MAIKVDGGHVCSYCNKKWSDPAKADSCRDGHELIYVQISKSDLNRLINFIYAKDESLLSPTLMNTLTKYLRGN